MITYMHASRLDASAAVKLVLPERGSAQLERYFAHHVGFYITSLCLAEALRILTRKKPHVELSDEQYLDCRDQLLAYVRCARINLDIQINNFNTLAKAEAVAR